MKGPQGKCNFPTWRILSTGYEALYDQGIRSAIFQASLIGDLGRLMNGVLLLLQLLSSLSPSLLFLSPLLPCLILAGRSLGQGLQLYMFLQFVSILVKIVK